MSKPESLSTQEPLADHLRRHAYDRLLMLSDGIFAIATTLAALEIHLPERMPSLEELTFDLARPLVAYLLSFVVTAIFWISHRNLFARLRKVDAVLTGLTLAMLCMIALVPVALHGMTVQGGAGVAIRFYAVIMLACGLANSAMWIYGSFRPGLMLDAVPTAERRVRAALTLAIPLLFGVILVTPADRYAAGRFPARRRRGHPAAAPRPSALSGAAGGRGLGTASPLPSGRLSPARYGPSASRSFRQEKDRRRESPRAVRLCDR